MDVFTYCFKTRFLTPSIANCEALLTKFENILKTKDVFFGFLSRFSYPIVVVPPSLVCETTLVLFNDFHRLIYVIASRYLQSIPCKIAKYRSSSV